MPRYAAKPSELLVPIGPPYNVDLSPSSAVNLDPQNPSVAAVLDRLVQLDNATAPPVPGDIDLDHLPDAVGLPVGTDGGGVYVVIP